MKISIVCGSQKAALAAEKMQTAMYDIHGTEARAFDTQNVDELYLQGGDAVVLADEGDNAAAINWLNEKGATLTLNGLLGAVLALDGGAADVLAMLGERETDVSASLALDGADEADLKAFGRDVAIKTAQLVGNWSLDFD